MFVLSLMKELYFSAFLIVLLSQCRESLQVQDDGIVKLSDLGDQLDTATVDTFDRLGLLSRALAENVHDLKQQEDVDGHILNDKTVRQKKQISDLPSIPLNHVNGMYSKRESLSPDTDLHHIRLPRQAQMMGGTREGAGNMNGFQDRVPQQGERGASWNMPDAEREGKFQDKINALRQTDPERAKKYQDQFNALKQKDPERAKKFQEQMGSVSLESLKNRKGNRKGSRKGKEGRKERKNGRKNKEGGKGWKGRRKGKKDKSGSGGQKWKKGQSS